MPCRGRRTSCRGRPELQLSESDLRDANLISANLQDANL
ncbi:pentapeptide repeat-containing protein, partial [Streptomyces sp. NPDC001286]